MGVIEGSIQRGAGVERGPASTLYVDTVNGATGASGASWGEAILTMAAAVAVAESGSTIFFRGRVAEHVTTPVNVFDVSIIGVSNRPRHADATPAGGNLSAQWQPPAGAATPLLKIIQQGWRIENVLFDAPAAAAAVQLFRDGGAGDAERDASHASISGCRFVGGATGIEDSGGVGHVLVNDCEFHDLTDGIKSVTGAGIGQPLLRSTIRGSRFRSNTNHIVSGCQEVHIIDNVFGSFTTKGLDLSGGVGKNVVSRNALSGTYSNIGGYTAGTDDEWGGNFNSLTGGVTAADPG